MGSKQVREAHMMRYGATLTDMKNGHTTPPTKQELVQSIARLSKPKITSKKFAYAAHSSDDVEKGSDLFPPRGEVDEVADVPQDGSYPEDWRKLPTRKPTPVPGQDEHGVLRDSDDVKKSSASTKVDGVEWLYLIITLSMKATNSAKAQTDAKAQVERLLRQHKAVPHNNCSKHEIREVVREGRSFVVLLDIIATRRSIMSGIPHDMAGAVYKYLEEYYPISVKFAFVGISDNATKLAARDVFNSAALPPSKRLPFAAVDSEHLFIAHVKSDEAEIMRQRGMEERRRKEEEARRRRSTPKYVPPPEPEWLQRVRQQQAIERTQTPAMNRTMELATCSRCWAHSMTKSGNLNSGMTTSTIAEESYEKEEETCSHAPQLHGAGEHKPEQGREVPIRSEPAAFAPRVTAETVAQILAEKKRNARGNTATPATELLKVAHRLSDHVRSTL